MSIENERIGCLPGLRAARRMALSAALLCAAMLPAVAGAQTPRNLGAVPPTRTFTNTLRANDNVHTYWFYVSPDSSRVTVTAEHRGGLTISRFHLYSHNERRWFYGSTRPAQRHSHTFQARRGWYYVWVQNTNPSQSLVYTLTVSATQPPPAGGGGGSALSDTTADCGQRRLLGSSVGLRYTETLGGGDSGDCYGFIVPRFNVTYSYQTTRNVQVRISGLPSGASATLAQVYPYRVVMRASGSIDRVLELPFGNYQLLLTASGSSPRRSVTVDVRNRD